MAEQTVDVWPETVAILLPALRVRQCAHARAQHLAVGQHDFHAAVTAEMIAERAERVADAVIERIADGTAPAGIWAVDPDLEAALFDVAVEIEVRDAGLDEREAAPVVDLENPVHALQVDDDAAREIRRRAAVTQVLAGRDRIKRNAMRVGDANDRLHLLDGRRNHGGGRDELAGLVP